MRNDLISTLEAIHDLEGDHPSWFQRVNEALEPALNEGLGVLLWGSRRHDGGSAFAARTAAGVPDGLLERLERVQAEFEARLPLVPALNTRATYGAQMRSLVGDSICDEVFARHGLDAYGVHDLFGISAFDPDGTGAGAAVVQRPGSSLGRPRIARARRIASHLLSGFRLRSAVARQREAVLSSSGKVLHAEGGAKSSRARAALADLARDIDRARGPMRRLDPEEALARWRALGAGRWTLVDSVERDGRRFVIAWHNEPGTSPEGALTAREQQVAAMAAQGMGIKDMAYALGLGPSTIGTHLGSAMRKLRVGTRAELAALLRSGAAR